MAYSPILKTADRTFYAGLSSETKPTSGVRDRSLAFETDTGDVYQYLGSEWRVYELEGSMRVVDHQSVPRLAVTPESGSPSGPSRWTLWTAATSNEVIGALVTWNANNDSEAGQRLADGLDDVEFIPVGKTWAPPMGAAIERLDHIAVTSTDSGGLLPGTTTLANVISRMVTHTFDAADEVKTPVITLSGGFLSSRYAYSFVGGRSHA